MIAAKLFLSPPPQAHQWPLAACRKRPQRQVPGPAEHSMRRMSFDLPAAPDPGPSPGAVTTRMSHCNVSEISDDDSDGRGDRR